MPTEIEAKLRLDDPDALHERLRRLGAGRVAWRHESNHLYDTPDGRLRRSGCGLRVRVAWSLEVEGAAPTGWLTFKGPRRPGELKVREELESAVDDAAAVMGILTRLGWREVVVYEKRREVWHLGACEVAIDELPRLGWWLEIEGPDADAVRDVRRALGLEDAALVKETYVDMAAQHGEADAEGCRRLVFGAAP
jgi:adenylate cyclase class 2